MNHSTRLKLTQLAAACSDNPKWLMACFLYNDSGALYNRGVNSAPFLDGPPWTSHAEETALGAWVESQWTDRPVYAYVARVNRAGDGRLARPCENCTHQLQKAGVREVFWTGVHGEMCYGTLL